jgi:hypothetical protein
MYKAAGAPRVLAVVPKAHYFKRFYEHIRLRPDANETLSIMEMRAQILSPRL